MDKKVGVFEVAVSSPYPFWTTIKRDRCEIYGIHHDDLDDLIYALNKAKEHIKKEQS